MTEWEVKARTSESSDGHARYHDGDWLTVVAEGNPTGLRVMRCVCSCGNEVYVFIDDVIKRREKRDGRR